MPSKNESFQTNIAAAPTPTTFDSHATLAAKFGIWFTTYPPGTTVYRTNNLTDKHIVIRHKITWTDRHIPHSQLVTIDSYGEWNILEYYEVTHA